jgi:hypothetical protein
MGTRLEHVPIFGSEVFIIKGLIRGTRLDRVPLINQSCPHNYPNYPKTALITNHFSDLLQKIGVLLLQKLERKGGKERKKE